MIGVLNKSAPILPLSFQLDMRFAQNTSLSELKSRKKLFMKKGAPLTHNGPIVSARQQFRKHFLVYNSNLEKKLVPRNEAPQLIMVQSLVKKNTFYTYGFPCLQIKS